MNWLKYGLSHNLVRKSSRLKYLVQYSRALMRGKNVCMCLKMMVVNLKFQVSFFYHEVLILHYVGFFPMHSVQLYFHCLHEYMSVNNIQKTSKKNTLQKQAAIFFPLITWKLGVLIERLLFFPRILILAKMGSQENSGRYNSHTLAEYWSKLGPCSSEIRTPLTLTCAKSS